MKWKDGICDNGDCVISLSWTHTNFMEDVDDPKIETCILTLFNNTDVFNRFKLPRNSIIWMYLSELEYEVEDMDAENDGN